MIKKRPPIYVIVVLILVLAAGVYWLVTELSKTNDASLTVSGTIEAVSSVVSPEMAGKIASISVSEGESVSAGDILFSLDDTLLNTQLESASASLETARKAALTAQAAVTAAQANYDLVLAAALQESATVRAADWSTVNPGGYTLEGGTFTSGELIDAAMAEVEAAAAARADAQRELEKLVADAENSDFLDAEKELLASKFEVQSAQDVLSKAVTSGNSNLKEDAQSNFDLAKKNLEDAQEKYDNLLDTNSAEKVLAARRDLVLATERVQTAQTRLVAMQTGENSLKVKSAQAALAQAQASADQAQAAVMQAEASVNLLEIQLEKLNVRASMDGIILSRSIESGEVLTAGAPAMTLGQLDPLTITVYVPESEIGQFSIGQEATLKVDSFPNDDFTAVIIHISDEAEYTPRNVQTTEGRKTTVFAVKLQVENTGGQLKPGMPADVTFVR